MKYLKWIATVLMLSFIGLFIYQNLEILRSPVSFSLDLYIQESARWSHPLYVLLLSFALAGLFAGIGVMLKPFLSIRRQLAQERQERAQAAAPAVAQTDSPPPASEGRLPVREEPLNESQAPDAEKPGML